jgi:hypothetical protein
MGVQHRDFDVFAAQQFLNRPDVIAVRQQVRGRGVPKGVGRSMVPGTFISSLFANPAVLELLGAQVGDEAASP